MNTVEICKIDVSYEGFRLRDWNRERVLLSSLSERGILEPLQGVMGPGGIFTLLDGFKRYRCAVKLGIQTAEYLCLGEDAPSGILKLIRTSNELSLHLVEQAHLVSDLHKTHHMSVAQIAAQVDRSSAWVSMRLGLLSEMSPLVKKEIFSGRFPTRSFMYTLQQFTRVKKVPAKDTDDFVRAVSGKNLSGRSVDRLARAYFMGGENFREQIRAGNFGWTLDRLRQMEEAHPGDLNEDEKKLLRELEIAQKYESRIIRGAMNEGVTSKAFYAEAELLTGGILRQFETYGDAVRRIYARCREAKNHLDALSAGEGQKTNLKTARCGHQDGAAGDQAAGRDSEDSPQGQEGSRSRIG